MTGIDSTSNRRRPLTARSVVASNLLGVSPPRLPVAALVAAGELFGLSSGATRTALSRMTARGEVEAVDGWYELRGALLDRAGRQATARLGTTRRWDGTWELAVVTAERRPAPERAALRTALRHLRLAEVREGLWARPDNLDPDRSPLERGLAEVHCTWVRHARPVDTAPFLAAWPLANWADDARTFVRRLDRERTVLEAADADSLAAGDLRDRFVLAADALRHVVEDPLLPAELQPDSWPSTELRASYAAYDEAFKRVMRSWTRRWRAR